MKALLFILLSAFILSSAYGQSKETQLTVSGGHISFGTGDVLGYYLGFGASTKVTRKSSFGLNKLLLGGEILFENGVRNPVIDNPTFGEFLTTFYHVSSSNAWIKLSYYPINKIIPGFNIQIGPTFGYTYRSTEERASRRVDALGQSTRESTLRFDNGLTYGYRISAALDFKINQKLFAGARMDFSNNNEAEINSSLGVKLGIIL